MIKKHHCLECDTRDPGRFDRVKKSQCMKCHGRQFYKPRPKGIKPYLCRECGEDDPDKFGGGKKSMCTKCCNVRYRGLYKQAKPKNQDGKSWHPVEPREHFGGSPGIVTNFILGREFVYKDE